MMKRHLTTLILLLLPIIASAQNVSIKAVNRPAAEVFRSLIEQTGKNFVYSSELLSDLNVTVNAKDRPLKSVLDEIFAGSDIEYKIKGKNVVLKRKPKAKKRDKTKKPNPVAVQELNVAASEPEATMLDEVVVTSRLEAPATETAEIGAHKVTALQVSNTPTPFGEPDVIKSLQMLPGVTEGSEGVAGMYVHGGNADENLYMLDNVPLYQVNHFAGLFSAFNNDIIRYIDFFKSSMPAKYDGRLSSFMDVRLQNGNRDGSHGTARLGLVSGTFNISGPIGKKTTYLVGLRRSWYDVLMVPVMAIVNASRNEYTTFHYYFMDFNAKVNHRFSNRANGFVSIYFGDDMVKSGWKDNNFDHPENLNGSAEDSHQKFHWGNLVAQAGLNYRFNQDMTAEFNAAYTRFFTNMKYTDFQKDNDTNVLRMTEESYSTRNNINDWILRGDFDWQPNDVNRVRFGANYVLHSFLPSQSIRTYADEDVRLETRDSTSRYTAGELNGYIEDDWLISDRLRINAGLHLSLFAMDRKAKHGVSPRLSVGYRPVENLAVKAAYSRTTQYVHQLAQSYLSLPTDQWIPVPGSFKPQTADKVAAGVFIDTRDKRFSFSVEGYYKWMRNIVDYRDEYYLLPPLEKWDAQLTAGKGTAKGIDFKIEKLTGKITGHISYTLAWADHTFPEKNGGVTFPARFDNRHTINILLNWNISRKVQISASWVGHSGNHVTLLSQSWEAPSWDDIHKYDNKYVPLRVPVNNYQLPFYHRLDLACNMRNSRGYWTFSIYNAYNHMNTIAVKRGAISEVTYENGHFQWIDHPVFRKIKLLPIMPTFSYTWEF